MRKRISDPNPPASSEPTQAEFWLDVEFMDVYEQISKKGDQMVVCAFRVTGEQYPIRNFYLPRHAHPFVLQKWTEWYEEFNPVLQAAGEPELPILHDIPDAVKQSAKWPMPYKLGCVEEFKDGYRNIRVVEYDWDGNKSSEPRTEDVDTSHADQAGAVSEDAKAAFRASVKAQWARNQERAEDILNQLGLDPRDESTWTSDDLLAEAITKLDDDLPF